MMTNGAFILSDGLMKSIKIYIYIFEAFTVIYSINVALFLPKVFKYAKKPEYEGMIPFYNIFALLKIIKLPEYYGLLFFIPIVNLGFIINLNKKLCEFFDKNSDFLWGMIFVPFIYMPNLITEKGKTKSEEEKKEKPKVQKYSMKEMDKNLLTDLELKNLNKEKVESEQIDSIFKADIDSADEVSPYRAAKQKVKVEEEEEEEEEAPVERETIKKVEAVQAKDIQIQRKYIIDEDTKEE